MIDNRPSWTPLKAPPGYEVELDLSRPWGPLRHRLVGETIWQDGPVPERDVQRLRRQFLYKLETLARVPAPRRRAERIDEQEADIRALLRRIEDL